MVKTTAKLGKPVPKSGQYKNPGGRETTLVKGKTAPPTSKQGQKFTLIDPTKHKK
jgi:hypothetical protein